MKVGLLVQNNLWFCPYVNIYTDLLNQWKIDYDLIFWNRDGKEDNHGISYECQTPKGRIGKLVGYWKYGIFLKKLIKRKRYDRLIVFSPQIGIFMSSFLKKEYDKRYIFDYRDLSIEQIGLLKIPFERLLDHSYANVLSSPGFKICLPKRDYIISHNFIVSEVRKAISKKSLLYKTDPAEVLTIGGIRDFEANRAVIRALSNDERFVLRFVGRGCAGELLEEYAKVQGTKNITFEGYYCKKDEPEYIQNSSFLNIYYPDKLSHSTALSNRFYNSLIYRRPMIVTKGQIQGDYAEKHNVGIAVSDPSQIGEQLQQWIKDTNFVEYEHRCIELLKQFMSDYDKYRECLWNFLNQK